MYRDLRIYIIRIINCCERLDSLSSTEEDRDAGHSQGYIRRFRRAAAYIALDLQNSLSKSNEAVYKTIWSNSEALCGFSDSNRNTALTCYQSYMPISRCSASSSKQSVVGCVDEVQERLSPNAGSSKLADPRIAFHRGYTPAPH